MRSLSLPRVSRSSVLTFPATEWLGARLASVAAILGLSLLAAASARAATLTVTTLSDSSDSSCAATCSLRDAMLSATSGDVIAFQPGLHGILTLSSALPAIRENLTIQGPGATLLTVSGNHAVIVFTISSGTVNLAGLTIANGTSTSGGGGIYNAGTLTLSGIAFSGDSTTATGGAIFNASGGVLTLTASTFSGNSAAAAGGALANLGTATINNSTFYGNSSAASGGATSNSATLAMTNNTFSDNSATSGGGISNAATMVVSNTILTGDAGGECSGTACPVTGANGNLVAAANLNLLPLGYYGGATQTMLPMPGSAAVCAGSPTALPAGSTTDQRGFAVNPSCVDSGSVQTNYQMVVNTADSGTGSLRGALDAANAAGSADIAFAVTGTINLDSPLPAITGQTNVIGSGPSSLVISATWTSGFTVNAGAEAAIYGVTIANGSQQLGGAVRNDGGTLTVSNCILSGNSASAGGAISNNGGWLAVNSSLFDANTSGDGGSGGAIYNNSDGVAVVTGSTFSNNSATLGGAISNYQAALTVVNSTFSANTAPDGYGGAILNGIATLNLVSSTVSGNFASLGSGMWNGSGSLSVLDSIIAGNTTNDVPGDDCDGCGTQPSSNLISLPSAILDPLLGPLQYNGIGAALETMMPLPGSAAICAGTPSEFLAGIPDDERGFPRFNSTYAGYSGSNPCLDLGAVQTSYSSVQFIAQPTNTAAGVAISPAPTVQVLETNANATAPNNVDVVNGVPVTLTYAGGANAITGSLTAVTAAGVATFSGLTPKVGGGGMTFSIDLPIFSGAALTAISDSFNVTQPPAFSSANAATGEVGTMETFTITTAGYPMPALSETGGLPPGVSFTDNGNGTATLSGIPTAGGIYQFTFSATNGLNPNATQAFTLTVSSGLALAPTSLPAATYGTSYTTALSASGGAPPYTLSASGTLPPGLSLNAGSLSGIPAAAGTFSFTLIVKDGLGGTATRSYNLEVNKAAATVALGGLAQPYTGSPVSPTVTTTPAGLAVGVTYNGNSAPPSEAGSYAVVATIRDANYQGSQSATLVIGKVTPSIAWKPASSISYGSALSSLLNAASRLNGNAVAGSFAYTAQAAGGAATPITSSTILGAGSYTLTATFTPTDATDYNSASATASLAITTGTLTAIANNATRAYGAANPVFTGSVNGALSGQVFSESFTTAATTASPVGAYAIVPGLAGADLGNYTLVTANGTLTVTKAASLSALTVSAASVNPNQSVSLTASVASATSGTPTGSVSFYDGPTLLGSSALSGGAATFSTASLAAGTSHSLEAVYGGDQNFTGSSASTVSVAVGPLDFSLAVQGPGSQIVASGSSATYQLAVTPLYGSYAAQVNFAASGLPAGAIVSFSPASIPANGGPQNVTVTVAIPATTTTAASHAPMTGRHLLPVAFAVLLLPMAGAGRVRRSGRHLGRLLCLCLFALCGVAALGAMTGCGVLVSPAGPPLQNYTVTVTAATGSLQHTADLTVQVK